MHLGINTSVLQEKHFVRVCFIWCFYCLVSTVPVHTYTPPTTQPVSTTRARYPLGYDPDNRSRPPSLFPASSIVKLKPKPNYTSACTRTRGEAKTARWAPHIGYDPRRPPPLRRTDTTMDMALHSPTTPPVTQLHSVVCPLPDCTLDPRTHLCMGIWMGRSIIERRCQKIE